EHRGEPIALVCGPPPLLEVQSDSLLRLTIPEPEESADRNRCGDGRLEEDEQCDDGNRLSGDGCSSDCRIEPNFGCVDGGRCLFAGLCGDGRLEGLEECDDGNRIGQDGCSANCQLEAHHICPYPGLPCRLAAACGDGLVMGTEQCDSDGPGCIACEVEVGWVCPDGDPCFSICGD